ncbi:hypothetical protein D3C73_1202600 [compost metagenome]
MRRYGVAAKQVFDLQVAQSRSVGWDDQFPDAGYQTDPQRIVSDAFDDFPYPSTRGRGHRDQKLMRAIAFDQFWQFRRGMDADARHHESLLARIVV